MRVQRKLDSFFILLTTLYFIKQKMSLKSLYIIPLLLANFIFAQKKVNVTFLNNNIKNNEVSFYKISKNKIDTLKLINSKLYFEYNSEREIKMIARFRNKYLEFYINPTEMYFLEIEKMRFSLNNLFRRKYIINQGFDYIEIVKYRKCKIQ